MWSLFLSLSNSPVQYMEMWLFISLLLCGGVTKPLKDCPCSHYPYGDAGDSFHLHHDMG